MNTRLFFTATERNRDHIGDIFSKFLPQSGSILEIASGSGEHGVTFQKRFPNICWQTSDPNPVYRKSISAWIDHEGLSRTMPDPLDIDVNERPWPLTKKFRSSMESIVCINMIHISPWICTESLFTEAGNILKANQTLIIYGPFKMYGDHTSQSNLLFDQSLKAQDLSWGVRDIEAVAQIGITNGFIQSHVIEMPANNFIVIFQKK